MLSQSCPDSGRHRNIVTTEILYFLVTNEVQETNRVNDYKIRIKTSTLLGKLSTKILERACGVLSGIRALVKLGTDVF